MPLPKKALALKTFDRARIEKENGKITRTVWVCEAGHGVLKYRASPKVVETCDQCVEIHHQATRSKAPRLTRWARGWYEKR